MHVDGYIALIGQSIIVGAAVDEVIFGRRADAFLAAFHAFQASLKLLIPKTSVSTKERFKIVLEDP